MLQIVIVLYNTKLEDSVSYQSLKKSILSFGISYRLLIYNNSPQINIPKSPYYNLVSPPENRFLLGAYNYAYIQAKENNCSWLLLLDQDSILSLDYFKCLQKLLIKEKDNQQLAAIIPTVLSNDFRHISPYSYSPVWGMSWFLKKQKSGITNLCLAAINSGTVLRISALETIGGFPDKYLLDGLDTAYFYRLYRKGFAVYIMETQLYHDFSFLKYSENMNLSRYESIVKSELNLAKEMGLLSLLLMKIKFVYRIGQQLLVSNKHKYIKITFSFLMQK